MVTYDNEFETKENKIKPRIKLKHDIHVEKKPDVWGFRSFAFVPIT